jgi:hypothetical protein
MNLEILNGLEFLYPDSIIPQLKRTLNKFPESQGPMTDAFSIGQLKSKLWLIDNLPNDLGTVFICAGWYGTLANLMFEKVRSKFDCIRSFDIDETCAPIADTFNRSWVITNWKFKASTLDILKMDFPTNYITFRADGSSVELTEMPDTIINTSCEHIDDFNFWYNKIPKEKLVILQSNNYFDIKEHVNCSRTLEEFVTQTPMTSVLYSGELDLGIYKRFMRMGIK